MGPTGADRPRREGRRASERTWGARLERPPLTDRAIALCGSRIGLAEE
jgi:hypothetical protein